MGLTLLFGLIPSGKNTGYHPNSGRRDACVFMTSRDTCTFPSHLSALSWVAQFSAVLSRLCFENVLFL